jgi:O-antigen/teichoic acid export membrane protein
MLGFFRSASEVGIYNAAAKTALLLNTILLNFSHIFSPIISALYEKGELTKLSYLYKTITKWCFSLSLPVFIILACLAPEIMSLFGHGFAIGWQPLAILAFAQFINVSTGPVVHILIMSGKQNLMVVNGLIICVINILLNFFLIPIYGIVGAALASSAAVVLFNASMLLEIKVMMNMFPYSKKFLKPVLIGLLSLLGLVLSKQVLAHLESPTKLLLFPLILFSIYVPCMLFWGLEEEDRLILNLIKQKLPLTKVI